MSINRVETAFWGQTSGGSGSCTGTGPAVLTVNLSTTTTAGELIVVLTAAGPGADAFGTLTDNLNQVYQSLLVDALLPVTTGTTSLQCWYCQNSKPGVTSVTWTTQADDTCAGSGMIVAHYTGLAPFCLDGWAYIQHFTASPFASTPIGTSYDEELLIGMATNNNGTTLVATGQWTIQQQVKLGSGATVIYADQITNGRQSIVSFTGTDPAGSPDLYVGIVAFIKNGYRGFSRYCVPEEGFNRTPGGTSVTNFPLQIQPRGLVCVTVEYFGAGMSITNVVDGNGNKFTQSPNSPSTANAATAGALATYYCLDNGNLSSAVTVSFPALPSPGSVDIIVDCFAVMGGGTIVFDKDQAGSGVLGGTGVINTPSFAPTRPNSLLYAGATPENDILGFNPPWIADIDPFTITSEAQLNATTTQNPNIPMDAGHWDSMMMSFYFLTESPLAGVGTADYHWLGGDDN